VLKVLTVFFIFVEIAFSAKLNGVVRDAENNAPLQNVNIDILYTAFGTASKNSGEYQISQIPSGQYTIRATCIGFSSTEITTRLPEDGKSLDIYLHPKVLNINQDIVVTAARQEENSFSQPYSISTINNIEIDRRMPRSTPEALLQTTGVWMQKTNHGGGSPFIRGLVGNQVLVLIDGVRLNNATFRYGPNQYLNTIGPGQIERIEVVRGAGSVTHGSDALGGVINIITKSPRFSDGRVKVNGRLYSKYMSNDMEQSGRAEIGLSSSKFALLGGFSLKNFGDIKAGGGLGIEAPSSYNENNADLKAKIKLSWRSSITLAFQNVYQNDVTRFDQVAQRGYLRYSFDPQIRRLGYARWSFFSDNKWTRSINLTSSIHKSIEQRKKQKLNSDKQTTERDEVDTFGISMEIESTFSENWSALSGFDIYRDNVSSWKMDKNLSDNSTELKRGLYANGAEAMSFALFSQQRFNLSNLGIEFGGRLSGYQLLIQDKVFGDVETSPESVVGNAGLVYSVHPQNNIFLSVSQGFRAPNINDVSSLGDFDYGVEVPSANLSPEKTLNLEAGFKSNFSLWASSFSIYRTNLYDLISRVRSDFLGSTTYDGQNVYKKQNVANAYIQGFEGDAEIQFAKTVTLYGSLIYTFGENESTHGPMRRIPPLNGKMGFRCSNKRWWADAVYLFARTQDRLSNGDIDDHRIPDGGTPGWQIVNINGGYSFSMFNIYFGLQNLFDEAYRLHGSGIDGYGRSFWIGGDIGI
jgi:hemoglobin/transferrin/lactoferrin receptor protein